MAVMTVRGSSLHTRARIILLKLLLVRSKLEAIHSRVASQQFDFMSTTCQLVLSWELTPLTDEEFTRSLFAILLSLLRAIIGEARWNLATLLQFSRLLAQCRSYLKKISVETYSFDCSTRALLWRWTGSCHARAYPKPCELIPMVNFEILNELIAEWQGITRIVTDAVPKSDQIPRERWFEVFCTIYSAQLSVAFLTNMSHALEGLYMDHNPTQLLARCADICGSLLLRSILRTFSLRVILPSTSPYAMLQAKDDNAMETFLDFIRNDQSFTESYCNGNVREYCGKSPLSSSRLCQFRHSFCDQHEEFAEEVAVTCFLAQSDPPHKVPDCIYIRDAPANHVVVSARDCQVRAQVISKFSPYLKLLDSAINTEPYLDFPRTNAQDIAFALETFVHIWAFMQLHREGAFKVSPQVTSKLANFVCESASQILLAPKFMARYVRRFIWRGVVKVVECWAEYLCDFYRQKRLTSCGQRFLSVVGFIQRILNHCQFPGIYSSAKLLQILDEMSPCLEDALLQPEMHPSDDIKCCQLCIEGCRRIMKTGCPLPPPLLASGIKIRSTVGSGTFGTVYKAYSHGLNSIVALKEIDLKSGHVVHKDVLEEVNNLRGLSHFHVLRFYDVAVAGSKLFIMTEFCSGGTLRHLMQQSIFNIPMVADVLFRRNVVQLLLGLSCLHGQNVVHGDLKPANLLMDDFERIKLGDFGAARSLVHSTAGPVSGKNRITTMGTIDYMSPETILRGELTIKSDIWSLGCTLFHLVTGVAPWNGRSRPWGILSKIRAGELFDLSPLDNTCIDSSGKQMIRSCLKYDPAARPSALELMLSPFLYEPLKGMPLNTSPCW